MKLFVPIITSRIPIIGNNTTRRANLCPLFVVALCFVVCLRAEAQPASVEGYPLFVDYYSHEDYSGHPQNWAIEQDEQGIIYVANKLGVLEFDGHSWRLRPAMNHSTARSLAVGSDGLVYAGFVGDFGYLKPLKDGSKEFVSLADSLEIEHRVFDDVWGTHAAGPYIYFQTRDRIFRWDGSEFDVFEAASTFRTSFTVYDRFYVRDQNSGLLRDYGTELRLVEGGEFFIDRQVYMMEPFGQEDVLIGTREDGLFVYDGSTISRFETDVDEWLIENRLYSGATVQQRGIVLGTLGGGIAVLDENGRLRQIYNEEYGLVDGWVNYVFADRDHGVWLAHHNSGITRLDLPSELTVFDDRHGLRAGIIYYLARDDGRLVVSTSSGLSQLTLAQDADQRFPRFEHRTSDGSSIHATVKIGDRLLIATDVGLEVHDKEGTQVASSQSGLVMSLDVVNDSSLYAGTARGIVLVSLGEDGLSTRPVAVEDEYIDAISHDSRGRTWAITRSREVLLLTGNGASLSDLTVSRLGPDDGVPPNNFILSSLNGETVLVSSTGVHRYELDPETMAWKFVPDQRFKFLSESQSDEIQSFVQDSLGRIWIVRDDHVDILTENADGHFDVDSPSALRIPDWRFVQIYVEPSGVAWLSNNHRLFRYDPSVGIRKSYEASLPPLIREVTLVETGERISAEMFASASTGDLQELEYRQNAVRFDFALPSYNDPRSSRYQYYMDGHDQDWSEWTTLTNKSYTNLFEGTYRLRVRGMNAFGDIGPEAVYTFRILPPWYRTIWAYTTYFVLLAVLGAFLYHYRRLSKAHRRAAEQAAELARERNVNERLQESYRRLQEANESLLQADKLKDEFLANTSHELRTPLTAILGFASILKEEVGGEHREFLSMIEENGKRLLHTLNSLLDLAKLRVGMMDINMRPTDVTRRAHEVGKLLMPLASKKELDLEVRTPSTGLYVLLDPHGIERVLYNLIGNAIKFTDSGGVTVVVGEDGSDITITVADTGVGIEEQFIPHIFDEFKQESSGNTREHEGTGLGLAITNRLIQIMNGSISVTSNKGKGSVFTITFPRYHPDKVEAGLEVEAFVESDENLA